MRWLMTTRSTVLLNAVSEQRKQQDREVGVLLAELRVCSNTKNLAKGQEVHAEAVKNRKDTFIFVATALINMYAKCGHMTSARQVFDNIRRPNVVSWTALLSGYAENGDGLTALELFARMLLEGCEPDHVTFVAVLKACTALASDQDRTGIKQCLKRAKQIRLEIDCHPDNIYVQTTLIDLYAKCGDMNEAREVFDGIKRPNVVPWTALILGYVDNGDGVRALDLFAKMKSGGCVPNTFTFVAALKACILLGPEECRERGKQIHQEINCQPNSFVQNTLIGMYAKCGNMDEARKVFESIDRPLVVSWNAIMLGYAEHGEGVIAMDLYSKMKSQGCEPDHITCVAALKACSLLGALEKGREIHATMDVGAARNGILVTTVVDFYAKCGSMVEAQEVFDAHPETRDLNSWTALLAGYSRLGDKDRVFNVFEAMKDEGLQPNAVTFLCLLNCCNHAGLVENAIEAFEEMSVKYGISPAVEHYNCMVDLLGRSNKLYEAIILLQDMPCPNYITWMTVLGFCSKWKNLEMGRLAFKFLVSLDDSDSSAYALMANIYGSNGMWKERELVMEMRTMLKERVSPGRSSWTDELGGVHAFCTETSTLNEHLCEG